MSLSKRGWKECKLIDVAVFQRGHDLPKTEMNAEGVPVAGSNGIIGYHNVATTKGPGITIGRSGNIGTPKFYEHDFWAHNTVLYVKDFKGNDEKFVYYFLHTFDFSGFNAGSAVPTLNRNHIHEIPVVIPPLPEQRAIAGVLSSLDDKIDLLRRQNKTLEGIAESLWRKMFVEEADPNWRKGRLGEFGQIVCGKTPSKKNSAYFGGRVPFIKIPDMHGNVFIFETEDSLTEEGKKSQENKTIHARSICVSCIATVGLVGMNVIDSQTNQQINTIIPNKDYHRYYLFLLMRNMTDDLYARASGGTATDNLNTGDFSRIEVSLPPDSSIKNFDGAVKDYFEKIYANQLQIRTLSHLRDILLPRLMNEEIKVEL